MRLIGSKVLCVVSTLLCSYAANSLAAEIFLNGKKYEGNSIESVDGYIVIDGEIIMRGVLVDVKVNGSVLNMDIDNVANIDVQGSVQRISSQQGNITTKNISGSASTISGDIYANVIKGSAISNSGNIIGDVKKDSPEK